MILMKGLPGFKKGVLTTAHIDTSAGTSAAPRVGLFTAGEVVRPGS